MKDTKINEILGAKLFQKFVFKIEKIKYMFTEKIFPNMYNWYTEIYDKELRLKIKKTKSDDTKRKLEEECRFKKMRLKGELVNKKNRNYHKSGNTLEQFIKYLNWNKEIHKKGMIRDIIGILILFIIAFLTSGIILNLSIMMIVINSFSLLINFQCVNLQNYNLKRIEKQKIRLKRIEEIQNQKNIEKYNQINSFISKELSKSTKIPSSIDIVSKVSTKELLIQMRNLLLEQSQMKENLEGRRQL